MKFRHEMKIEITKADFYELRMRLNAVMKRDENGSGGKYEIRSLYFDTPEDRLYDGNADFIRLEVKRKIANLTNKESCVIDKKRVQAILDGDVAWMPLHENALVRALYDRMKYEEFAPKTVVEYTREAFLYEAGNVRVTLDYDIRTGVKTQDFLKPDALTVPVWDGRILLEVKWDEFLPDLVREAVRIDGRGAGAFSKYAQARIYG